MKIERVSENQLKLTLTKADLVERDIRLEDLMHPSEKTQKLFHDIMEQALSDSDFITENAPLMVEAVPSGPDGIMIIVTKVSDKENSAAAAGTAQMPDARRWKKAPMDTMEAAPANAKDILIYSFAELEDVIRVSLRLDADWHGASALYKNEGRYYLILEGDSYNSEDASEETELVLREYGSKHISIPLSKYYLMEHGEAIIKEKAVKALAKTFAE